MLNIDSVSRANTPPAGTLDWAAYAFASEDGQCEAYNEAAFQYFLEIERKRCESSNRPLLLLLIEFAPKGGALSVSRAETAKFFSCVAGAVRESDFIGWYREGRVVGIVLTQHDESHPTRTLDVVRERLTAALQKRFDGHLRSFQIRSRHLSPELT